MKKAQEQRQKTNAGVIRREVREKIAQWLMDPAQANYTPPELAALVLMRQYEKEARQ